MIGTQSLTSRLIVYCAAGSFLIFVLSPVLIILPASAILGGYRVFPTLEAWTTKRARELVLKSIRVDAAGEKYVEYTNELRAHVERNPGFQFAAFDAETNRALKGSSENLASYFRNLSDFEDFSFSFHLSSDANLRPRGNVRPGISPLGAFHIVVYGSDFHWDDILYQAINMRLDTNYLSLIVLGVTMAIVAIVAVAARCGLAPLRDLATTVSAIDINSLDRCLSIKGAPSEMIPFIDAVNGALERVREGVERHRRFTANSAHELRTPITIIRSRVETLDDSPLKQELSRDVLRMQTLVEQLLVLAQVKERGGAAPKIVDVRRIVLAVATDYAPIAIDNGKTIEFEAPPHPIMALGFQWAIECIVSNLVANAVRAEPLGGAIIVRVHEDAVVEVVDHGVGVAPQERSMVFEPFWRRREESSPGSGLGLSIVKQLVEETRGAISIEETSGGGATFKLSLPRG